jgi:hypothetical protein
MTPTRDKQREQLNTTTAGCALLAERLHGSAGWVTKSKTPVLLFKR